MDVGEHDLGGGDQVEALAGLEQVVLELRQLAGAGERLGVGEDRRPPLLVAGGRVGIEHEADERPLQLRPHPAEQDEPRLGELHRALEVDDAQRRTQVPVRLRLEVEVTRRAPAADLDVVVLVGAHRSARVRQVGAREQQVASLGVDRLEVRLDGGDPVVDAPHGVLRRLGLVALAVLHERADRLGRLITLRLKRLDLADELAPLLVESQERVDVPRRVAARHRCANGIGILADESGVEHEGLPVKLGCEVVRSNCDPTQSSITKLGEMGGRPRLAPPQLRLTQISADKSSNGPHPRPRTAAAWERADWSHAWSMTSTARPTSSRPG